MTPLPALVAQDGSLISAPQIGNETEKYAANPLDKIFTYTPIPTVILDSSLQVVEVSKSYLTLFNVDKEKVLGSPLFNLHEMSASHHPLILGVLSTAISTRSIQLTDSPWGGCERLQVTPIFDGPSLLYLNLELQTTSPISGHQ
jgi:osomolarity two-component system sensor histidine kinase TcsA